MNRLRVEAVDKSPKIPIATIPFRTSLGSGMREVLTYPSGRKGLSADLLSIELRNLDAAEKAIVDTRSCVMNGRFE